MSESIFITSLSGFFGMVAGMLLLAGVSFALKMAAVESQDIERVFFNPSASLAVASWALVILVTAGLIAGYVPARRAASIRPIEALHDE